MGTIVTFVLILGPIILFAFFGPEAVAQRRFEKALRYGTADEAEKACDDVETIRRYSTWRAMFTGCHHRPRGP